MLFEHGKFNAEAGMLTFNVLKVYAAVLAAYVGTEVVTRGLIALRDTCTPLLTNSAQLATRGMMMALLVRSMGVVAVPLSLAVTASVETIILFSVLLFKIRR